MNKEPYIKMWRVNRGWIVQVGCQELVFTEREKDVLVAAFNTLIRDGVNEARKQYCDRNCDLAGESGAIAR